MNRNKLYLFDFPYSYILFFYDEKLSYTELDSWRNTITLQLQNQAYNPVTVQEPLIFL